MIEFKPVRLEDKQIIERHTMPSGILNCDLAFANMYCWQAMYHSAWAVIDGFLVIRFHIGGGEKIGYMQPVGEGDFAGIIPALRADAHAHGQRLRIIGLTDEGREMIRNMHAGLFAFESDRALEDYVYNAEDLRNLTGRRYQPKRNHINRFTAEYPDYRYEELTPDRFGECMALEREWRKAHEGHTSELCAEQRAMQRAFDHFEELEMLGGCIYVGDKLVATPLGRGAGNITTVTRAQGDVRIPEQAEGLNEHAVVPAELSVSEAELDRILVCVGSHDNTLDLLADELMGLPEPFRFASTHVGSMGGITALKNGSCHLSGMHLFDPGSDDFNFPFIKKFLPDVDVTVINLAIRHQGIIVPYGNPMNIQGIDDFTRVRFINRQRGAGTRILLDWKLKQAGLKPSDVKGYDKEEFTHMAVAVNVLTGAADCGMGIYAAAKALGLDFVPLALERYDLVIPTRFLDDPRVQAVRALLDSPAFKARIEAQGGYDTPLTGQIMAEGEKRM